MLDAISSDNWELHCRYYLQYAVCYVPRWVSEATGGGIVCVNDVRFHVDGSDTVIVTW